MTTVIVYCSSGAEPMSAGDVPADPLMEDGEEAEPISKEEAAERLLVGSCRSPGSRDHVDEALL